MKPIFTYGVATLGLAAVTAQVAHWTVNPGLEGEPDLPPPSAFAITATGAVASAAISGAAAPAGVVVNTIEGEDQVLLVGGVWRLTRERP